MTRAEIQLHVAKKKWASFETGLAWDELDDYGRDRNMHHASVALEAIEDAGCVILPKAPTDQMVELAALAFIEHEHGKQPAQFRPGEKLLAKMRVVLTTVIQAMQCGDETQLGG